jgi:hypothetical protein
MIVMQYRFTLPADYDMAVIETRIRENGAKLDGFLACWLRRISFPGARTRIALRIAMRRCMSGEIPKRWRVFYRAPALRS